MLKVLALSSYPIESAATRFRLSQYIDPLRYHDIDLTVSPYLDKRAFEQIYFSRSGPLPSAARLIAPMLDRIAGIFTAGRYDVLLVQREAMPFGPAIFERLYSAVGRIPLVLDLDDATYLKYESPTYGRLGSAFKFFGKTDGLIDRSVTTICGNPMIAEYVNLRGKKSVILPTTVDGDVFCPIETQSELPVIGWIGTHSTYPFLENLFPVIERLAAIFDFKLMIVGSGKPAPMIKGAQVESKTWTLDTEVTDFQSIDIGLYPMFESASASTQWLNGKSGFKAIQYLAVGRPFVMSPVGVAASIGIAGETHFNADDDQAWYVKLESLLQDRSLREKMGSSGRKYFLKHFDLSAQAETLALILKEAARSKV